MTQTNIIPGATVFSATITFGELVIFSLPDNAAGTAGTVTKAEAADWSEQDWRHLANQRDRQRRNRQRRAGLTARMSPAYEQQVLRGREQQRPRWTTVSDGPTETDIYYGSTLVETWRYEQVPGMGRVWACYPAGHAYPTGYAEKRPQ